MSVRLPREKTVFITPEGMISFPFIFPGQAQDSYSPGSKAYKITLGIPQGADLTGMTTPMQLVEQTYGPGQPSHIFGRDGLLRKPEETGYKEENKAPFAGMYIVSFSQVVSPKSVLPKDAPLELSPTARAAYPALSNPEVRDYFDRQLAARAPKVVRFPNLSNPADIAAIETLSHERVLKSMPAIPEAEYYKTLLPVQPHELWAGCYGQVSGRVYWAANRKPAQIGVALESILLTRPGDRLVGENNPETVFQEFAPAQELAPQAPAWNGSI